MVEPQRTLGIMTGGGDCPGLNAVVRAAARRCMQRGVRLLGYKNGWEGVLEGGSMTLDRQAVKGILPLGGTVLGTSRTDPIVVSDGLERWRRPLASVGRGRRVVVGGGGRATAAAE